jgi:hypothetical protein
MAAAGRMTEKAMEKRLRQEEAKIEKEKAKQVSLAVKEREKQLKLEMKQREKEIRDKERSRVKIIKNKMRVVMRTRISAEKQKTLATIKKKAQEKEEKFNGNYEVSRRSLARMFKAVNECARLFPDGWTTSQFTKNYMEMFPNVHPYTGEELDTDTKYDIKASIRGLMYETSPSSTQHWFRYGLLKKSEEIAPWFCYNKALAVANNIHGWKLTTSDVSIERRREKGKWFILKDGSNSLYNWSDEIYGPLPTPDILSEAAQNRPTGVRKAKQ